MCRNDYNIVFSILFLLILGNFYNQNPQITSKIIIHILLLLIIADIIWIIAMSGAWSHSNTDTSSDIGKYWDSLYSIHTFVYVLAFFELILKGLLIYYLFVDYKDKYTWKDLIKFNYSLTPTDQGSKSGSNNELMKEQVGFEEEFKNAY